MRYIDAQAIEDIAAGAAVLGTGGGGDPYIGKMMALQAIEKYGPIPLLTLDELDDDALVVPSSMIGAPTVMVEKVPAEGMVTQALNLIEQALGKKVAATMPIEVGGVNSIIPLVVAAEKGIPVIDADAMGRAFPEAQMVTFYLDGLPAAPTAMTDERGNGVVMYPVDGVMSERLARSVTIQMGGSASMCDYPLSGKQVKQSAIPGTLTLAQEIGALLRTARSQETSPVRMLIDKLGGFELFTGKTVDISRRTESGFTKGQATFDGIDDYRERRMTLGFQNEHLVALENGQPLATTPDLLAVLDKETGMPITTEGLKYGTRVSVVAIPCHPKWRTEKGIETVGPRYFGYDFDYVPVEQLVRKRGEQA